MISSMTGFARKEMILPDVVLKMEVKSLNHRFLEINLSFSRELNFLEPEARKWISHYFSRGKIDGFASVKFLTSDYIVPNINKDLLNKVISSLDDIEYFRGKQLSLDAGNLLTLPAVFTLIMDEKIVKERLEPLFKQNWEELIKDLKNYRDDEGQLLLDSVRSILAICDEKTAYLKTGLDTNKNLIENSIKNKIKELNLEDKINPQRLSEEVFFYLIKTDVTEEVIRLEAHFKRFKDIVTNKGQGGKELEFLLQEMNREVQTILSKVMIEDLSNAALELKCEIERLRQQIQNIE